MSYVIQSCNIREIGQEAELTPKIEFPSCESYFVAMYHGKKSSFSYGKLNQHTGDSAFLSSHQTSSNEFKTPATESSFIPFLSFCRIVFRSVDMFGVFVFSFLLWIRQFSFQHLKLSFVPVFLVFFFLMFTFQTKFYFS